MAYVPQSKTPKGGAGGIGDAPIICKICLSVYDDGPRLPLNLSCMHTFCASCIADSLMTPDDRSKVFCPLCKSKTLLGKRGIAGLKVNEVSLEMVRTLAKRKQLEQMEVERRMGVRPPDWGNPPYQDDLPQQAMYPLGSAKPAVEPGKPKGILKVKSKQNRLGRTEFQLEATKSNGSERKGGKSCSQCAENGNGNVVSEQHRVIVKSANRLHPPPNSSTVQPPPEVEHPSAAIDSSQVTLEVDDSAFPSPGDPTSLSASTFSSRPSNAPPGFLKPLWEESLDPHSVIPEDTPDPFRTPDEVPSSPQPNGRIYPVKALLYMASEEGVPRDQIGSADPETTSDVTVLTESQRVLPPGAKYVGRFGKYSEKRQPGAFSTPQRIACSSDGTRLAVTDPQAGLVHVFSSKGEFVCSFVVSAQLTGGVCFLEDDHVTVTSSNGVHVHLVNGTHRKTVPVAGVMTVAPFKQGFVAAARNRVSVCKSLIGSVIHSINGSRDQGVMSKQTTFDDIADIAVGPKGELCILQTKVLLVMDEDGVLLSTINPGQDSSCGQLGRAVALAVCPEDRSIVLVDAMHRRVLLFGPDGQFVQCLLNYGHGDALGVEVCGVVVKKSRRMFAVTRGEKMAEVRVYSF